MLDIFFERFRQKHCTVPYPAKVPTLPPLFKGRPVITPVAASPLAWQPCLDACPTKALQLEGTTPALDMGACIFCGACSALSPEDCIQFSKSWQLGATRREDLIIRPGQNTPPLITPTTALGGAFSRSLRLRQVSAAGCGACEADLAVLTTIVFDIARFGIDFVASPRHADALVLTGPVPRNMSTALGKCAAAMATPKFVMAVGACAISGGLFRSEENYDTGQDTEGGLPHMPVDLYIPGCPPHPYTTLDAWLRFLGIAVPEAE